MREDGSSGHSHTSPCTITDGRARMDTSKALSARGNSGGRVGVVGPKQVSITRHCHPRRARGDSAQRGSGRFRQALVPALAKDSGRCRPSARPDPASLDYPLSSRKWWQVKSRCVPVSSLPGRHRRAGPAPGDAAARRGRAHRGAGDGRRQPGASVLAIDFSRAMVALLVERAMEEGLSSLDARVINGLGSAFGSLINCVSTSLIPRANIIKPSCPASMIRPRPLLPRNRQAPPPVRWRGVPADLTRGIHRWMQAAFKGCTIGENWMGALRQRLSMAWLPPPDTNGASHAQSHRVSMVASHSANHESENPP
jgi:hypothetical protein